ncbi:DUF3954 domain-containing protein [Carnobacterium divergens]|nr:DUF3954 domain-containing protein [Carnobacterium divergens]
MDKDGVYIVKDGKITHIMPEGGYGQVIVGFTNSKPNTAEVKKTIKL